MAVNTDSILKILGYEIDNKGNIKIGETQMAIVTIEDTEDGGILRLHGDSSKFFYRGEEVMSSDYLYYPDKISSKYLYFTDGEENGFKVSKKEIQHRLLEAMATFQEIAPKNELRG